MNDYKHIATERRRQPERPSGVNVLYGAVVITWALMIAIAALVVV